MAMTLDDVLSESDPERAQRARNAIRSNMMFVCPACGAGHSHPGRCRSTSCFAGAAGELIRTGITKPPFERHGWPTIYNY